jgi:hypothetical protein
MFSENQPDRRRDSRIPEAEFLNFDGIDSTESIPPAYVAWRAGMKKTYSYSFPV